MSDSSEIMAAHRAAPVNASARIASETSSAKVSRNGNRKVGKEQVVPFKKTVFVIPL